MSATRAARRYRQSKRVANKLTAGIRESFAKAGYDGRAITATVRRIVRKLTNKARNS